MILGILGVILLAIGFDGGGTGLSIAGAVLIGYSIGKLKLFK